MPGKPTCQPGCIRGPGHKIVCIGADNRALGPPMPEPRRPVDNTDLLALGRELVEVWIGFEAGEEARASKDPNAGTKKRKRKVRPTDARRVNRYPLIEWAWCRCRAVAYIRSRGFAVPRKSACMGCCYNSMPDWQTLQREQPAVFGLYAELEARKPPTSNGVKMSITGFKMLKKPPRRPSALVLVDNIGRVYRAPPLPEYVKGKARGPKTACQVCGAGERATKAVGCGWLAEAA